MKDDFSQDEKNSLSANDDSLDWAKQAYLQLKQKQKEEKELCQKEIEEKEILKSKTNEDFKSNITVENSLQVSQETEVEDQPQLEILMILLHGQLKF